MTRDNGLRAAIALCVLFSAAPAQSGDIAPRWIAPAEASAKTPCRLSHSVPLEAPPATAWLQFAADFGSATVEVNRQRVVKVEPFSPTVRIDIAPALRAGDNEIAVTFQPIAGPAAVAVSVAATMPDGRVENICSDETWMVARNGGAATAVRDLGAVEDGLWGIGRRPPTIDPFDNYEQWRLASGAPSASPAAFWTAPGFEISLIRTAQPEEGSWVSLAFDPQGRLTIAREDKGLLRMTLAGDAVTQIESINDSLLECRGLLYAHGALYANANNSKGLFRLRSTKDDDRLDEVTLLREFPGGVGHGRNDLALGPDGRLSSIGGDDVDIPQSGIVDHTSPFREARRGQATREGWLLRTDANGQNCEVVAAGMRNPFGVAFNADGEAFTYDADAEFDMGAPWYRPTRVLQLSAGADFGWRGVTGRWPPYFPDHADVAPFTLDIGKGSPTAVVFGTGAKFPRDYQRALFILDWAYGRILAVHLAPRGSGYRASAETFLKGRPLNVTDLAIGPDGAMYLTTGGRRTQSALYRVIFTGKLPDDTATSGHEAACAEQARAARALRDRLHAVASGPVDDAVGAIWPSLSSEDPLIRNTARTSLERVPADEWKTRALSENDTTAKLEALTALARSDPSAAGTGEILGRLLTASDKELTLTQLSMVLNVVTLCRDRGPEDFKRVQPLIVERLNGLFPMPDAVISWTSTASGPEIQRALAQLLVELDAPGIVPRVMEVLLTSNQQEDRLQALFILRHARNGWTPELRHSYFAALREAANAVSGEGMPRFLEQIRKEAVATLTDDERRELAPLLAADAIPVDPLPPLRPVVQKWTTSDAEMLLGRENEGDAAKGETIFRDALCVRCHRTGARGPAVGPDLTHVAGRFSRRDILESILNPSRVIAENYRNVAVQTLDGRTLTGRVIVGGDYRSEVLKLATDPLNPGAVVEIHKREIESSRESDVSPMPSGLLDSFPPEDVRDLLAYLSRRTP